MVTLHPSIFQRMIFIILLTHTPDYAEDTDVSNANLVLAGHTHGGQVSLFKKYSPVKHSIYGTVF